MAKVAETENFKICCTCNYAIPHSISGILARESLKPKHYLPVITTLHGTDITSFGAESLVPPDYALRHCAVRPVSRDFALLERSDEKKFFSLTTSKLSRTLFAR